MFEKEAEEIEKEAIKWVKDVFPNDEFKQSGISRALVEFAELGYNKANEWHKADIPTSQINKVVLGYIKDYNSKMFCLVKWNGEWWYDARTYNERVKLIAWREIVLPKGIEEND